MAKNKLKLKKKKNVEEECPLENTQSCWRDGKLVPVSVDDELYCEASRLWDTPSFEKAGYVLDNGIGEGNPIDFFYRRRATNLSRAWPYVVIWSPTCSHGAIILCQDSIELLNTMQLLTPYLLLELLAQTDTLHDMGKKAFRAFHGHHFYTDCDQCAPEEMNVRRRQMQEEDDRRLEAAKNGKGTKSKKVSKR